MTSSDQTANEIKQLKHQLKYLLGEIYEKLNLEQINSWDELK